MTIEEIKSTPKLVDFMLDESVIADSREKLRKRLEKVCNLAIKALEQESCENCISRADVEQTVEDNILCYTHSDRPIDQDPDTDCHKAIRMALRMLRKDLRKLPPVTPQPKAGHWIPCSERLPERYKAVIVTDIEISDTYQSEYVGNGYWECDNGTLKNRIIAWMPLPEPFRTESEETDADREESKAYCAECDHIEMCSWYPHDGCEWLKTDRYNVGYNAAKREIALSGEYERAYERGKADAHPDINDGKYSEIPKGSDSQGNEKINCKSTKCEKCINHNYCDFEPQKSEG